MNIELRDRLAASLFRDVAAKGFTDAGNVVGIANRAIQNATEFVLQLELQHKRDHFARRTPPP